jgi:hypothetical protein
MKRRHTPPSYTTFDELLASPDRPLPQLHIDHQLGVMRAGLDGLLTSEAPGREQWAVVADCINLLETLVDMGAIEDEGGWIAEAARELAQAAQRFTASASLRLTGAGVKAVQSALEGYELAVTNYSARTMIRAHRLTEKRIREIRSGKCRPHGTVVVSL